MPDERKQFKVARDSGIASLVRDVAESGTPVLVDTGDALYEVVAHVAAPEDDGAYDGDSFFDIIGMSAEGEPTDIALHKDAYLAEALSPKRG